MNTVMLIWGKNVFVWVNTAFTVLAVLSVLHSRKSPQATLAWILALIVLPVAGLVFYLILGLEFRQRRRAAQRITEEILTDSLGPMLKRQRDSAVAMLGSDDSMRRQNARTMQLLTDSVAAPITSGNSVRHFYTGKDKFQALFGDLEAAQESICMEYYIWRSDEIGRQVLDILTRKAANGVVVRLIFDGWGSFCKISPAYKRALRRAGIEYTYYSSLKRTPLRSKINNRNHRKIVVIDGKTAYLGGMNLGKEYIDGGRRFETWRDTHLRIEGPAAALLEQVFLIDRSNSGRHYEDRKITASRIGETAESGGMPIQIVTSGPDSRWNGLHLHYMELVAGAREEILIQTPYLIPGEAMEQTIITAVMRGVRVAVMTVGPIDKRFPFWASMTYWPPLLEAGVEIYRYFGGFLHAKVCIQDRQMASVGTCNVDLRSFCLDYEANAVMYCPDKASELAAQFDRDLDKCTRILPADLKSLSPLANVRNATVRLLSPLM